MRKFIIRSARKSAHLGSKALHKALRLTTIIEDKATRLLNGVDFSIKAQDSIPLEKIYYNSLPYITPLNPALPAINAKAAVVLLIPSLDNKSFYGGTATALIVAAKCALQMKRDLVIVQTIKTGKVSELKSFFAREGVMIGNLKITIKSVADRTYNTYGYISMHPDDLLIASAWWDAYLINQLPLTKKFLYLVQDFEPIFYNNSDLYVLAESTYKQDSFIPLCNTRLMYDFMHSRNYPAFTHPSAQWFEPAVSRVGSGKTTEKGAGTKKRLFLYGRPDVHRNLFFTALSSIDYSFKANFLKTEEWELFMAGQDNIPDVQLTSGIKIKNLGKMSMEEYTKFSKTIDVAVSPMMAPHPNYPTLELASIGAAVVTTKYSNKTDLSNYSPNILVTDIDTEAMAGAIKEAAAMSYEARMKGVRQSTIETSWDKALDSKLKKVLKSF